MKTVTNSIFLSRDPSAIFDLVTTAKYWPEWHPATVGVSGQVQNPMHPGDLIRERAKIGQDIGENNWTVTDWEKDKRVVLEMPGTRLGDLKITYRFEPKMNGVQFTRELSFDASGFPEAVSAQISRQMDTDSAEALKRIKVMAENRVAARWIPNEMH